MDLSKIPEPSEGGFGDAVRFARKSRGMTLKQVADKMGYTLVYQSEIERGIKRPTRERIAALSKLLGLDRVAMTDMVYPKSVSKAEYDEAIRHGKSLAASVKHFDGVCAEEWCEGSYLSPDDLAAISFFEKFGGEA